MAQRVCVTGASGQAGRAVVADLREHGYDVTPTDVAVSRADREDGMLQRRPDRLRPGRRDARRDQADAVVHLANIPAPGLSTPAVTFNSNITMNFNVFQAAAALKLNAWCGRPARPPSACRSTPRPATRRSTRTTTRCRPAPTRCPRWPARRSPGTSREWSGIPFVALRFSNIMAPEDYEWFAEFRDDPHARKWNLWGYIDQRDVALSCRLALEADAGSRQGQPRFHHRGRQHGHEPPVGRTPRRGLPRRQADPRRRRVRHPAGHRPRPRGARLRARALLARPCNSVIM